MTAQNKTRAAFVLIIMTACGGLMPEVFAQRETKPGSSNPLSKREQQAAQPKHQEQQVGETPGTPSNPTGGPTSGEGPGTPHPLAAPAPAAKVTAVDAKTGVITGKVNSTGQVFTFTLANKAQLSRVHPGQGVFVNLGNKQVSLDGKSPSGTIITILPASGDKPATPARSAASSGGRGISHLLLRLKD